MSDSFVCAFCGGECKVSDPKKYRTLKQCPVCDGEGEHWIPEGYIAKDCKYCNATGRLRSTTEYNTDYPCHKCKGRGKRYYKEESPTGVNAIWIKDGETYKGFRGVQAILNALTGKVRVCDPNINDAALETLQLIDSAKSVQVLYRKEQAESGAFSAFKAQYSNFEFCKSPDALHDRYVLCADTLILLGGGLSNIGKRGDSFIVELTEKFAEGLIKSCRATFDDRWARGKNL